MYKLMSGQFVILYVFVAYWILVWFVITLELDAFLLIFFKAGYKWHQNIVISILAWYPWQLWCFCAIDTVVVKLQTLFEKFVDFYERQKRREIFCDVSGEYWWIHWLARDPCRINQMEIVFYFWKHSHRPHNIYIFTIFFLHIYI